VTPTGTTLKEMNVGFTSPAGIEAEAAIKKYFERLITTIIEGA
jgi:hypothetical protein